MNVKTRIFFSVIIFFLSIDSSLSETKAFAQGNLAVVIKPKNAVVMPNHHIDGTFSNPSLWCQGTVDGKNKISIERSDFERTWPPHRLDGEIIGNRSYLKFKHSPHMHDAGKYVCNIYNEEYGRVWGNLFVYMRPMFYTNGTTHVKDAEELEDDQYAAIASSVKFSEGDTAILHCPVYGYPTPEVEWYKDGEALDYETGHFEQRKEMLYIHDVGRDDEGLYRCKATNKFPASNNEEEDEFTSVLDQQLRISNSLGWILPLIIIIVIFIILFAIIYFCALCSRRKSDQYDVEKQEKNLRRGEQQKLREQDEEEE